MQWIEELFGIAPDGGNGTTELLLILIPVSIALFLLRRRHLGRRG